MFTLFYFSFTATRERGRKWWGKENEMGLEPWASKKPTTMPKVYYTSDIATTACLEYNSISRLFCAKKKRLVIREGNGEDEQNKDFPPFLQAR